MFLFSSLHSFIHSLLEWYLLVLFFITCILWKHKMLEDRFFTHFLLVREESSLKIRCFLMSKDPSIALSQIWSRALEKPEHSNSDIKAAITVWSSSEFENLDWAAIWQAHRAWRTFNVFRCTWSEFKLADPIWRTNTVIYDTINMKLKKSVF